MNVDGNVTNVSVSDNLSSEDSSKATEEAEAHRNLEMVWTLLNEIKGQQKAFREDLMRTSEPP